jgi:hypothetical protein
VKARLINLISAVRTLMRGTLPRCSVEEDRILIFLNLHSTTDRGEYTHNCSGITSGLDQVFIAASVHDAPQTSLSDVTIESFVLAVDLPDKIIWSMTSLSCWRIN